MAIKKLENPRTDEELARMIVQLARAFPVDALICGTETGELVRQVRDFDGDLRLIAAAPNAEVCQVLKREGFEVLHLPVRVANKYKQAQHAVSMALKTSLVSAGDMVVCAIGHDLCQGVGDFLMVTDVELSSTDLAISELVKLTDGIRPVVLDSALEVACKIGQAARRGKRIGALIMLGDSDKVLEGSRQLILNPLQGHEEKDRILTEPRNHQMLIELAKLDGAFVVRGDGFIRTAGVFLAASGRDTHILPGLGARHTAAAATSARSAATAVVVSATDGQIRGFVNGQMAFQMNPDVPFGQISKPQLNDK